MGADSKAIIYYGMRLPEYNGDKPDYLDANDEWRDERGPKKPTDLDYKSAEWDQWRERLKTWEKSEENIEIDWSGWENDQSFYIHAKSIEIEVEWSKQKPLSGREFIGIPWVDQQIKAFCERFGFEYKQPEWHLASVYF